MGTTETTYILDNKNRIVHVSPGWDQFASQNSGEEACSAHVIGHQLKEFVSGDSTLMWIVSLVNSARLSKKKITKFYRCDSPEEKRFMRMTLYPEDDGAVAVSNKLIRVQKMHRPVAFRFQHSSQVERCSVCNRVHIGEAWLEPDDAVVLGFLKEDNSLDITYSLCERCQAVIKS